MQARDPLHVRQEFYTCLLVKYGFCPSVFAQWHVFFLSLQGMLPEWCRDMPLDSVWYEGRATSRGTSTHLYLTLGFGRESSSWDSPLPVNMKWGAQSGTTDSKVIKIWVIVAVTKRWGSGAGACNSILRYQRVGVYQWTLFVHVRTFMKTRVHFETRELVTPACEKRKDYGNIRVLTIDQFTNCACDFGIGAFSIQTCFTGT